MTLRSGTKSILRKAAGRKVFEQGGAARNRMAANFKTSRKFHGDRKANKMIAGVKSAPLQSHL